LTGVLKYEICRLEMTDQSPWKDESTRTQICQSTRENESTLTRPGYKRLRTSTRISVNKRAAPVEVVANVSSVEGENSFWIRIHLGCDVSFKLH